MGKYTKEDIELIHPRILHIINQILEKNDILLSDIEIVTPNEKNLILNKFNDTKTEYPKSKTISMLFEEQVNKTPNSIAIAFGDKKLTYKELNEKANSLANYLRNSGIARNDLVGIMVNRSLEMIISILAVLKAGGAYIPIDPTYPKDRIEYMLDSSNAKILLTQNHLRDNINFKNKVFVDLDNHDIFSLSSQNLKNINTPEDLAYVIFTSGSTGKPKGVMLMQKNIVNFIFGMTKEFHFSSKNTIVSITTMSFDIFVLESLMPLLNGLKVVIANEDEQTNVVSFNKLCIKHGVEIIQTTPSRILAFLHDTDHLEFIKKATHILIGGEPFPITLLKKLKEITNAKIYNMYGPTETAVWSSVKDLTNTSEINIGLPISNTKFYILDENLHPVPLYTPGELYIAGDGVCSGYLNNKLLTEKNFIKNPFMNNSIMYKTGDLGLYLKNGEMLCLGRSDYQVKIRGLRIELGEIEDKISEISGVSSCVVVKAISDSSYEFLCAYYTSNTNIETSSIRNYLEKFLPSYMIPSYFIKLDSIPHTPNGKIDRKALPMPQTQVIKEDIVPPRNDIDSKLVNIFKNLLKLENISIDHSFFELGGDSLSAINLCIEIQKNFHAQFFVKDILEHPSVKSLSDIISKNINTSKVQVIQKVSDAEYYPASSAQKRMYFASQTSGNTSILYNIPGGIILDGKLDIELLENCLKTLITRHESLRTYFEINDENVVQKIIENIDFKLDIIKGASFEYLSEIFNDFVKPFDLSKAPLLRVRYIDFVDNKSALFLDIHHIISDGASLSILTQELCMLYNGKTLPEIDVTYKDFTAFEDERLLSEELKEAENYWVNSFSEEIPVLDMPFIYPRPAVRSFEGKKVYSNMDVNLTDEIENLSNNLGITPYIFLISCYYILLSKYTSQNDIVVGTPILGRDLPEVSNLIGMFVNTLALREKIDNSLSIKDFILSVKENVLNAHKYSSYPFDELVKKLNIKRDTSRNPLFDTMFVYQNKGLEELNFNNVKSTYYAPDTHISKFDLSLEVIHNNDEFELSFEYCIKLFNEDFIENLSKHYINIIKFALENMECKVSDIDMLSEDEKKKILSEFNNTDLNNVNDKTISGLFEEQVEKSPNNVAVVFENKKLTYKELNEKANSLANYLKNSGITNKDVVSILLNRSLDLIIAIYAVIKSGASYVLIDTTLPQERINYIINDSASKYCIINDSSKTSNPKSNYINISDFDYSKYDKNNLNLDKKHNLCMIYTSGSTGNPKGVLLHEQGFINLFYGFDKVMGISKCKNILGISTVSFDMFAVELFSPLLSRKYFNTCK